MQNSNLRTAKSLALQLKSIWSPPWLPLLRQAVFCICSAHATLPCCQSWEPHAPASGKQPISGISLRGDAQLQAQLSSKLWGNRQPTAKTEKLLLAFSPCVLYKLSCLSLDVLESRLDHHLKVQTLNPAKDLLVNQRCSFNTAGWHGEVLHTCSPNRTYYDTLEAKP